MSLYIRLSTNFFSHVKTIRLKAAIGNDALWIPQRFWVYAAEHQPDGVLSKYTPEEIGLILGYSGNAQALLEAMLKVGFLDSKPLRIHGWAEHNGFHKAFSERASKAAKARWKRHESEMRGDEMRQALRQGVPKQCPSIENAMAWMKDTNKNGSDYNEAETRGAWLALNAGGWTWGKREVADWRSALERQIQTDRDTHNNRHPTTKPFIAV